LTTVTRVVAPNPGPYTGPGTNTWILEAGPVLVVIDPGPDDDRHLEAINRRLAGATVGVVLVTHSHLDHLPLAERLARPHHASVKRHPELGDGDVVRAGTLNLIALHTPGHSSDHLCFWIAEDRALFTGDLVLGRGSSMVTYPEGNVADYLRSLDRIAALEPRTLFPGHWDPVTDAARKIDEYRTHRLEREAQVLAEVRRGSGTAGDLTRRVYGPEVGDELMQAAEMTMRAHLQKLVDEGRVRAEVIRGEEVYEAPLS
jgi:glyoxylase-like metal-dependent hydrolase (beta-lactamase superfamily II)